MTPTNRSQERRLAILRYIRERELMPNTPAPSLREMQEPSGSASSSVVAYAVAGLERKGYLVRGEVSRSVFTTKRGRAFLDEQAVEAT